MSTPEPDLDAWAQDEVYRELMRIARGLDDPLGEKAFVRRLGRLTAEQRADEIPPAAPVCS